MFNRSMLGVYGAVCNWTSRCCMSRALQALRDAQQNQHDDLERAHSFATLLAAFARDVGCVRIYHMGDAPRSGSNTTVQVGVGGNGRPLADPVTPRGACRRDRDARKGTAWRANGTRL